MVNNTCSNCNKMFESERYRSPGFCSSKCRTAYHRASGDRAKRLSALQALGYATGLKHIFDSEGNEASQRLNFLSSHALYIGLADMGYVYANGSWVKSSDWLERMENE